MRPRTAQFAFFLFKNRETWHFRLYAPAPIRKIFGIGELRYSLMRPATINFGRKLPTEAADGSSTYEISGGRLGGLVV